MSRNVITFICNGVIDPTDPGVPYFVEVRVIESVRGLGLPRASSVFFSQETGQELSVMLFYIILAIVLSCTCSAMQMPTQLLECLI